jgi:hypothetical protein
MKVLKNSKFFIVLFVAVIILLIIILSRKNTKKVGTKNVGSKNVGSKNVGSKNPISNSIKPHSIEIINVNAPPFFVKVNGTENNLMFNNGRLKTMSLKAGKPYTLTVTNAGKQVASYHIDNSVIGTLYLHVDKSVYKITKDKPKSVENTIIKPPPHPIVLPTYLNVYNKSDIKHPVVSYYEKDGKVNTKTIGSGVRIPIYKSGSKIWVWTKKPRPYDPTQSKPIDYIYDGLYPNIKPTNVYLQISLPGLGYTLSEKPPKYDK